jgi:hypothetical protein
VLIVDDSGKNILMYGSNQPNSIMCFCLLDEYKSSSFYKDLSSSAKARPSVEENLQIPNISDIIPEPNKDIVLQNSTEEIVEKIASPVAESPKQQVKHVKTVKPISESKKNPKKQLFASSVLSEG